MRCRAVSKFNLSINGINYIKNKEYEYRKDIDGYIIKGENGEYKFTEYDACELFNKRILIKYYDELVL